MSSSFQKKKLVNSLTQAPNLGRLLCRSKFESQQKIIKWKIVERIVSATLTFQKLLHIFLKVAFTTLLLVCVLILKESTCETSKNILYLTSKA